MDETCASVRAGDRIPDTHIEAGGIVVYFPHREG